MNKLLLLFTTLLLTASCSTSYRDHPIDTCPSDEGFSCPIDGSPCPFCGRTVLTSE